jgi:hypothetical protein
MKTQVLAMWVGSKIKKQGKTYIGYKIIQKKPKFLSLKGSFKLSLVWNLQLQSKLNA